MDLLLLTSLAASPLVAGSFGVGLALALLIALLAVSWYAGPFYSVPRWILKWWSGRALRAA